MPSGDLVGVLVAGDSTSRGEPRETCRSSAIRRSSEGDDGSSVRSESIDSRVSSELWISLCIGIGGTSCLLKGSSALSARLALRLWLLLLRLRRRSFLSMLDRESLCFRSWRFKAAAVRMPPAIAPAAASLNPCPSLLFFRFPPS